MAESTKDWVRFALGFLPLAILAAGVANKLIRLYLGSILDAHKKELVVEVDKQVADARRAFESNTGEARLNAFNALTATQDHEKRLGEIETKVDLWWDAVRKGTAKLLLQATDTDDRDA